MRRFPRPRHEVSPVITTMAKPLFRYSSARDAYILRGVGRRIGPVLRPRTGGGPLERPGPGAAGRSRPRRG